MEHGLFSGIQVPWEAVLGLIKARSMFALLNLVLVCMFAQVAPKMSLEQALSNFCFADAGFRL